jgi:hypothetical protein
MVLPKGLEDKVKLINDDGIKGKAPFNKLLSKFRNVNAVKVLIDVGIVPVNLFILSCNACSIGNEIRGICPVKALENSAKFVNAVKEHIDEGMDPNNLFD